jgi:hypothetical protein
MFDTLAQQVSSILNRTRKTRAQQRPRSGY